MKILYLPYCFILLFLSGSLFAQEFPIELVPQSPDVYSLAKYGDIPVSLYTGIPDISIPIGSLNDHNLKVNVSLSYYGSGIKVDEIASWVGLGWSLNAGGVIARTVRGKAEEVMSDGTHMPKRAHINFYDESTNQSKTQFIADNELNSNVNDTDPDIFYYNFNGRSGKFYFDKNGNPLLCNQEGISIKWEYPDKFVITDEQGNIYEFNNHETTTAPGSSIQIASAWYLSNIKSPQGNEITFEYYPSTSVHHLIRNKSEVFVALSGAQPIISVPADIPVSNMFNQELRVHKIITNTGSIEFNINSEKRKDYPNGTLNAFPLEEIVINGPSGMLKKFKLYTSYFEANDADKYTGLLQNENQHLNYRLRLDSIEEISNNNSKLNPYKFTYYGDDNPITNDPYSLPFRLSPSQDHWGFFNAAGNSHIFPGNSDRQVITCHDQWYLTFASYSNNVFLNTIRNGANRDPNPEAMKACMLKDIYYPSGGYTEFLFEPNGSETSIAGGLRIQKIINYSNANKVNETDYSYETPVINYNPKDHYYNYYMVGYLPGDATPQLGSELLQCFGLPVTNSIQNKEYIRITAQPQAVLGGFNGPEIAYNVVNVSSPGNGHTTNIFDDSGDYHDYDGENPIVEESVMLEDLFKSQYISDLAAPYPNGVSYDLYISSQQWPYPEVFSNDWKRGKLSEKDVYSEDGKLLREEHHEYNRRLQDVLEGFKLQKINSQEFVYAKYYLPVAIAQLKQDSIIQYDKDVANPIITNTKYYYDNLAHLQPTRIETDHSDGKKEITVTTYPLDYAAGTTFIDAMKANHLLAYPIEQVKYLDNGSNQNIVSGTITQYKADGLGLKDNEQVLENTTPISLSSFKFSNKPIGILPPLGPITNFSPDNQYSIRLTYPFYDNKGNIQNMFRVDGPKTCYVWGYNGAYPIAQIKNAEYSTVEALLGGAAAIQAFRDKPIPTEIEVSNFLSPLRNNPLMNSAQITSFFYKPLVGMTSQTDPKGMTITYEYDDFQRLKTIKDLNGKIVKSYDYHYKILN